MRCFHIKPDCQQKTYRMELRMFLLVQVFVLLRSACGQQNEYAAMRFATQGKEITLPCAVPSSSDFLKWKFIKNNTETEVVIDAAQIYPGNIKKVFIPFDSPPGRSDIQGGNFIIHQVEVRDEGHYWCEIADPNSQTAYSVKYPVHVYVTPLKPQITSLNNNTLTEHKNVTVARCSSQGGKPGSTLVWMNGSTPMSSTSDIVYQENAFSSALTDGFLDLLITNPTRYDHKRVFSCIVDHPAYEGQKQVLNYTILVKYHPINARIWANLSSLYIFCEAESYPSASYTWKLPGGVGGFKGSSLYIQDLYDMPGYEYFECTASNGIPPNATVRMKVDDLLYPGGKPGWLGLDWWIWGVIIGGVVALILLIILIIYCVRKRKTSDKPVKYTKSQKHSSKPDSLQVDINYRRPDGREDSFDSRTPSPINEHKRALIGGVFDNRHSQGSITLIPSGELRRSRENMYADDSANMHASREQLDQVASHIQTLNKSWDHLSKSRQQLNEAQDELQGNSSGLHKSREQLYHSREALNRDTDQNYPYIDEGTTQSTGNEYYPGHDSRYPDEQDGYNKGAPPSYEYDEQNYNTGRGYQGYDSGNQRYNYDSRDRYDNGYRDDRDNYGGYRQNRDDQYDDRQYNYDQGNDRQGYGYRDGQYR